MSATVISITTIKFFLLSYFSTLGRLIPDFIVDESNAEDEKHEGFVILSYGENEVEEGELLRSVLGESCDINDGSQETTKTCLQNEEPLNAPNNAPTLSGI
ncbi:hypothetical protein L2E82_15531 [Cichorium intybus]|uniref:Uncharacterized protein n=1 Tax=Cichorium intybus TaxID=13427 RepID=A0ACB9F323_CICIN|nr:hypothetical protein L2E82_15531 [Cichorium intybus]